MTKKSTKKYILKEFADVKDMPVYEGELYDGERPTNIGTEDSEIIVTQGNYIFTDADGNKFGVAAEDVKNIYKEV